MMSAQLPRRRVPRSLKSVSQAGSFCVHLRCLADDWLPLARFDERHDARSFADTVAQMTGLTILDRSTGEETVLPPDEIDRFRVPGGRPRKLPPLPSGSRLGCRVVDGTVRIAIPPPRLRSGQVWAVVGVMAICVVLGALELGVP